jgi:hypothetical protein
LSLFGIKGRESTFIDQLFPEQKMAREQEEEEKRRRAHEVQEQRRIESMRRRADQGRIAQEQYLIRQEELRKEREKALELERERQKQIAEMHMLTVTTRLRISLLSKNFRFVIPQVEDGFSVSCVVR